jgi:hypothetical protein
VGDRGTQGAKGVKKTGQRLKVMPTIECDGGFLWEPYVPRRNDWILYYYYYYYLLLLQNVPEITSYKISVYPKEYNYFRLRFLQ